MKSTNEKGITLIALIITVIILVILLALTELILPDDLFKKAEDADKYTVGVVENSQSDMDAIKSSIPEITNDVIPECNPHIYGDWQIIKEATYEESGIKTRTCIICGKEETAEIPKKELIIGAYIEGYDPSIAENGSTISTSYTSEGVEGDGTIAGGASGNGYGNQTFTVGSITKWRIVGKENGQIIITTADSIQVDGGTDYYLKGQAGYENFREELNKISSIYGQGKYADTSKYSYTIGGETIGSGGRSITLEDIGCTVPATPNRTYIYTKNWETGYIGMDGTAGNSDYTEFIYWGEDAYPSQGAEWKKLGSGESVTMAFYDYTTGSRTDKQKEMVFKTSDASGNASYYLGAVQADDIVASYVHFAGFNVWGGTVSLTSLYASDGDVNITYHGVRPVVYLKSDIQLEYNTETETYTIK